MKNYYSLVAGLKEYFLDSETKGFDARAIIDEVLEEVSPKDSETVKLFYSYYDIENILSMRSGRSQFSELGNFTQEELEEQMHSPEELPRWLGDIILAYNAADKEGVEVDVDDDLDISLALERNLFAAYYKECGKSRSKFLREWSEFDATLRNITAAFAARRKGIAPADVVVGEGDIVGSLSRSSAADFGLKGEVGYIDQIMAAISDQFNLIEKEQKIDAIRWETAEELTALNYFDINYILGYLAKVNIVHRWATLDPEKGKEMLAKLIESLTGGDVLAKLEQE